MGENRQMQGIRIICLKLGHTCTGYVPLTEEEMEAERQRRAANKAAGGGEVLDGIGVDTANELELLEQSDEHECGELSA
jgi:hypothetical protein